MMNVMENVQWFTRKEAAAYLSIHPSTIARWVRQGLLKPHRIEGTQIIRYKKADLDNLLKEHK